MSLSRHAGRIWRSSTRPRNIDHVWIGEDHLEAVFYTFVRQKGCIRHVGSAPGPLEARRRSTKRKIAHQSATNDLFGLGHGIIRPWEQHNTQNDSESHYIEPETKQMQHDKSDQWTLTSWMQAVIRGPTEKAESIENPEDQRGLSQSYEDVLRIARKCTDLSGLRNAFACSRHKEDGWSQKVFIHMLTTERPTKLLLEFLGDPILNPPCSGNLILFLNSSKAFQPNGAHADIARFEDIAAWIQMQLSLGRLTMQEIDELSQSIVHLHTGNDELRTLKLIKTFVEGIEACPVLEIADVKLKVIKRVFGICAQLSQYDDMRALVYHFIKILPHSHIEKLIGPLSKTLVRILIRTHESAVKDSSSGNVLGASLKDVFTSFIKLIPQSSVSGLVLATSRRLIHQPLFRGLDEEWWQILSAENFLMLFVQSKQGNEILESFSGCRSTFGAVFSQNSSDLDIAQCILQHWCPSSEQNVILSQMLALEQNLDRCLPLVVQHVANDGQTWTAFINRLFSVLGSMRMTPAILNIISKAKKMNYVIPKKTIQATIRRLLPTCSESAQEIFMRAPNILMENYPEVAENFILAQHLDPTRIWTYFNQKKMSFRERTLLSAHDNQGDLTFPIKGDLVWDVVLGEGGENLVPDNAIAKSKATRASLLERMAASFAIRQKSTAEPLYMDVFRCLKIHVKERLGPIGPLMVRSLVETGLVDSLRRGRFVHQARIGHILALVAKYEGEEVAKEMEQSIQLWCKRVSVDMMVERSIEPEETWPEGEPQSLYGRYGSSV